MESDMETVMIARAHGATCWRIRMAEYMSGFLWGFTRTVVESFMVTIRVDFIGTIKQYCL